MTAAPIRQVAVFGLPGQPADFPPRPLVDSHWSRLLRIADEQRLAGLLNAAIQAGSFPVTDDQRAAAELLHLTWCEAVLRIERRLLEVASILDTNDVEFVVLKGSAVAHLAYPDPALRLFGDTDLLFRSEQFDWALSVLADAGYTRPVSELRPGFDRRFGKGATLYGSQGDQVDAHRTLVFGTFALTVDLDELFRSAVTFELGGRPLRALGPETRLLHACYHAGLGDALPRYSSLRDIAQMLATGDHDHDRLLELADNWQGRAVLARALSLCEDVLEVSLRDPIVEALAGYEPSRREVRAISSYSGSDRRFAGQVLASLPYISGVREKAAFLQAMAFPSRYESQGVRSGAARLRRGLQGIHAGNRR